MNTVNDKIKHHEKCIRILELINSAKRMKAIYIENINQYGYQFPELKKRYEKKVNSYTNIIIRLNIYYKNQLKWSCDNY